MTIQQRKLTSSAAFLTSFLFCASHAFAQTTPVQITLHQFTPAAPAKGGNPYAGVTIGEGGVLYGTTSIGGSAGFGTVFSLSPPTTPGGEWRETVLHNFAGFPTDGQNPGGLVISPHGVLYGATYSGGSSNLGTVFALTPPVDPNTSWIETVLHNFTGAPADGSDPYGALAIGADGTLYGTALSGGSSLLYGAVFSLTPPSSPYGEWKEAILHSFSSSDGFAPSSSLAIGEGGVLYGTTQNGGHAPCKGVGLGCGVVFSLTPPASPGAPWTEAVLHEFTGMPDGAVPGAGVAIGRGGVLYGTTENGGSVPCGGNLGCGTVFAVTPPTSPGGTWTETVLYSFGYSGKALGVDAQGTLAIGRGEVLYGTTTDGGAHGGGMVFSLAPPASPGGPWTMTVLYSFPQPSSGAANPYAGVVIGPGETLYGTTYGVPNTDSGTVFALTPQM